MARFRQCTRLELAASFVLLATIVSIVVVMGGFLRDSRAQAAERVTAICRPLLTAVTHADPAEVTNRDITRLRQETTFAAEEMRKVIKDTQGELRRQVIQVHDNLAFASDEYGIMRIRQRAEILTRAGNAAKELGASCPSPLTPEEANVVDKTLGRK